MDTKKTNLKKLFITIGLLVVVNFIGHFIFHRFDLTADKRYTLSKTSLNIISQIKEPIYVDVFLQGNFPGEFKKLQTETQNLLEEFKATNSNIIFRFYDPLAESDSDEDKKQLIFDLFKINGQIASKEESIEIKKSIESITNVDEALQKSFFGNQMLPIEVTVNDKGKQSQESVLPWAIALYQGKVVKIPLLKNMMGASTAEKVVSSVQHLEYAFANAFNTISKTRAKKIAILKGNGELEDYQIADFLKSIRDNYYIGTFTLDSVAKSPENSLKALKKYDLAVIAKPTEAFSDAEKQVLDQFIINGGKTIWLVDQVTMEMDSLMNTGANLAFPRDLNLNDMFFKYGFRIKPDLVKDIMATPISLATGNQGSATQYTQFPWLYSPMIYPAEYKDKSKISPIVSNLDAIKFEFTNPIELLNNGIKKTILLQSSPYSKAVGTPFQIDLKIVSERPDQKEFVNTGNLPVAVLLEGNFNSVYQNRVLPFKDNSFTPTGKPNKMIVISDGDVIKNQLDKNRMPLELGYDKWTNNMYANKEFMMNCVNYLLDDNGLINIRSKEVDLPLLDKEKVFENYTQTQIITIGFPILTLLIFGVVFTFLRKRKYSK